MRALLRSAAVPAIMVLAITGLASFGVAAAPSHADRPVPPGPELVDFDGSYEPGTVVVKTSERRLYLTTGNGKAYRYAIAVGEPIRQWSGDTWVSAKRVNPDWRPTARMRHANPRLPGFMPGGANNPLGVRALYLGWSEYRIHGTTKPSSIGTASSNGCFRMHNADVVDLYDRVHVGAPVIVLR